MSLVRRSVVAGAVLASALLGGSASASTGASQTVTYTIVETREVSVEASPDGSGLVSWSGPGTRMTVSLSADPGAGLRVSSGGTWRELRPGGTLVLDAGSSPLAYEGDAVAAVLTLALSTA